MFENIRREHRDALDAILQARHTVRAFQPTPVAKEDVEQIIRAGLIAPFASFPAAGKKDFRKIIVIPSSSAAFTQVEQMINDRLPTFVTTMEEHLGLVPFVQVTKSLDFSFLVTGTPYLIIAGERKGIPALASESLSYCLCQMWLKATSLKIGYRPVTFIAHLQLGNDREFCQLLRLPPEEYCIGYLVHPFPKLTTWSITSLLFFFVMWYSTKEEVGEFLSCTRERSS